VTFDIDANGIVNVSAADKGTGQRWMGPWMEKGKSRGNRWDFTRKNVVFHGD
jgi:hypothetical protein